MEDAGVSVVDLVALAQAGSERGILWTWQTDDLNLNLLTIGPDTGIAEHVNAEVDVLLVGIEGKGCVLIDGGPHTVGAGQVIVIPKGVRRSIRCEPERFTYLTCHRRRPGLWPQQLRRGDASGSHGGSGTAE